MTDDMQAPSQSDSPQVPQAHPDHPPAIPASYPDQPPSIPASYPDQPPVVQWPAPADAVPAAPPVGPPGAPPSVPVAKSRSPKMVLGIGIGCGLLLCACVSAMLLISTLSSCSGSKPWTLTSDQQRVMKEFGPPKGFSVAFVSDLTTTTAKGKEPPLMRLETWQYPSLATAFSFRDGVFVDRAKIELPGGALTAPAFRPDAFSAGMSPDQVSKIVKAKPDKTATVLPNVFKGLEVQSYGGQLIAGYQDGKLVVVQVFPVTMEGAPK